MAASIEAGVRSDAIASWDAASLGQGQVHVVSLQPLLSNFFEQHLHVPTPNRAAADAVTQSLQKGRRHWTRDDYATWCVQLALPWVSAAETDRQGDGDVSSGGGYGSGGYGGYGGGYGGTGGGMYGGRYGGGGFMGMGGPFGLPGDPDKDGAMPPGLRHLEGMLFAFGRITQMLEMNFDVLQHFLGSMISLFERLRHMYQDAKQLTTTVSRNSLEFGQSSLSTVREARTRLRRHPLTSLTLISLALAVLLRAARAMARRRRLHGPQNAAALGQAFASTALDAAWR